MKGKRLLVGVVVAFAIMVPLIYYLLFEQRQSGSEIKKSYPRSPTGLRIKTVTKEQPLAQIPLSLVKVEGNVEIRHEHGSWQSAQEGTVLEPNDRIRTDPTSRAVLSMPGVFSVELDVGSDFGVRSLAEDVARFLLKEGMISADVVSNSDRQFEVSAAETVARTNGARFKMSVDQQGLVALGTSKGKVEVQAAGKVIQVNQGYLTRIVKGKPPKDPIEIPSGLFLKVRWPQKRELSSRTLLVSGRTRPGARVRVGGIMVLVDAKGRFKKRMTLKEGPNLIQVESYDVGGNQQTTTSPRFLVDTRPDAFNIRTSPDMWEKKKQKQEPAHPKQP